MPTPRKCCAKNTIKKKIAQKFFYCDTGENIRKETRIKNINLDN